MARTPLETTRRRYAREAIKLWGYAVCLCGQMFATEQRYIEHTAICDIVKRSQGQTEESFTSDV